MRRLSILLPLFLIADAMAAESPADAILDEALATLTINDLGWLDRAAVEFSATAGISPSPVRAELASRLFGCKSLDGIDPTRPSLIAWRKGPAPLVAMIALENRQQFIAEFGAAVGLGGPLTRIGERNGTVVYSQNTDAGLCEYRLLMQDDTAYLARTVEECRLLASSPLRAAVGDAPPISFRANGSFLRSAGALPDLMAGRPGLSVTAFLELGAYTYLLRGWPDLLAQMSHLVCDVIPQKDNSGLGIRWTVHAEQDSALIHWIGEQKNQSSRLLPLVGNATSVLTGYGSILWQGQLERIGLELGHQFKDTLGTDRWTPTVEQQWHQQWAILDQQGPFAFAVDLPTTSGAPVGFELRWVTEQPHADELSAVSKAVNDAFAMPHEERIAIEPVAIGTLTAQRGAFTVPGVGAGGFTVDHVHLSTNEHQFHVISSVNDAVEVTSRLAQEVHGNLTPQGHPGILVVQANFTDLARAFMRSRNQDTTGLPTVAIELNVRTDPSANLIIDLTLPLQSIGLLLRDSQLLPVVAPDAQRPRP
jgi:hypothetical protein